MVRYFYGSNFIAKGKYNYQNGYFWGKCLFNINSLVWFKENEKQNWIRV